jgi:hypothetical protein
MFEVYRNYSVSCAIPQNEQLFREQFRLQRTKACNIDTLISTYPNTNSSAVYKIYNRTLKKIILQL